MSFKCSAWIIVGAALLLSLSACQQSHSGEAALKNYLAAIGTALGTPVNTAVPVQPPQYPRRRDLLVDIEQQQISLVEFVGLDNCDLKVLIAERNSAMGKMMPASQRLIYEHHFQQLGNNCLQALSSGGADSLQASLLAKFLEAKRRQLPQVIWNATFAGAEFEQHFAGGAALAELPRFSAAADDMITALRFFSEAMPQIGQYDYTLDRELLEASLYRLGKDKAGGQLLRLCALYGAYLQAAADLLRTALADTSLCAGGQADPRGTALLSAFRQHYPAGIQRDMTLLHRYLNEWLSHMEPLYVQSGLTAGPLFSTFADRWLSRTHPQGLWQTFNRAIGDHTAAWQAVLDRCGASGPLAP